jgi:long-chain acyl-CoA synthetase
MPVFPPGDYTNSASIDCKIGESMSLLHDVLHRQATARPEHPAVIDDGRVVTYGDLWHRVRGVGAWLQGHAPPGARVGVMLGNSADAVAALYGAAAAGLVAVALDSDIHPRNLAAVVADCDMTLLLVSERLRDRAAAADCPPLLVAPPATLAAGDADAFAPAPGISPGHLACVLYTTGTTGPRKGVMLSHANLLAATANMNAFMRPGPWLVESVPMRLSHSFGFARLRAIFDVGGTALLEEGLSRVDRVIGNIARHAANALAAVPAGFGLLLDNYLEPFAEVAGQLRLVEIGSAPMPARHRDLLMEVCPNARICMHYGLTEASRAAFLDFRTDRAFLDTVGRPAPNVQIRIAADQADPAAPGQGEVLVSGDMVALGYWRRPDLTDAAIVDGWLHTGDIGWFDALGYLHLTGRREDILNLGGMKVAAAEVEERLRAATGIADAAVVLGGDDTLGPHLAALLVLHDSVGDDLPDLRAHCLAELEPYKVPREFVVVDALPRTATGKLQRHLLGQLTRRRTWTNSPTTSAPSSPAS